MRNGRRLARAVLLVALATSLLASCSDSDGPLPQLPDPCVAAAEHAAASSPRIVLVVEENHSFSQIIGKAPFLTSLERCGTLLTKYRAADHPSLPKGSPRNNLVN